MQELLLKMAVFICILRPVREENVVFLPYEDFGMTCALRLKMSYFIDILLFR